MVVVHSEGMEAAGPVLPAPRLCIEAAWPVSLAHGPSLQSSGCFHTTAEVSGYI